VAVEIFPTKKMLLKFKYSSTSRQNVKKLSQEPFGEDAVYGPPLPPATVA
jgi:hypothetical protein